MATTTKKKAAKKTAISKRPAARTQASSGSLSQIGRGDLRKIAEALRKIGDLAAQISVIIHATPPPTTVFRG
jgi:hypothetical protein